MSVSQSLGGIPAIAAAVVVVVGIVGALIGFPLLKLMRVTDPEAQGLAMGPAPTPSAPPPPPSRASPRGFCLTGHGGVRHPHRRRGPLLFAIYHWLS